jgi:3-deoxy-D-manno-octulosonic-acid transferase
LKYDRLLQDRDESHLQEFRLILAGPGGPVWLAASTHPGEEEVILEAYEKLLAPYPALELILAPRHPERTSALAGLLSRRGLAFQFWSRLKSGRETRRHPVVIIDTIGDLFTLFGVANVTFVGGSLVPHGGQNILEPAAWGRAPIYGPNLENFIWAKAILEEAGAGIIVTDAVSLTQAVQRFLAQPEISLDLGRRAQAALIPHQGAARRQAELIATLTEKIT